MRPDLIGSKTEELLAIQFCCTAAELHGNGMFYTRHPGPAPHVQILAYGSSVVVCASEGMLDAVRRLTAGKTRNEVFELPYACGLTIYYVPSPHFMQREPIRCDFEVQSFHGSCVGRLSGLRGFEHAVEFAPDSSTSTQLVVAARKEGRFSPLPERLRLTWKGSGRWASRSHRITADLGLQPA